MKQIGSRVSSILFLLFFYSISLQAQPADRAQLPIQLDPQGRPMTELTIGKHKVPVLIDTGSNTGLHLTKEVMALIPGLKLTGKKIRSLDLSGKERESEEFIVPDFVANGVHFGEVRGEALIPWGLSLGKEKKKMPKPISVIGLPLFERTPVLYDLTTKRFSFGAIDLPQTGWQYLPFERKKEGLIAIFTTEKHQYKLILDSAANSSIMKQSLVLGNQEATQKCDFNLGPDRECRLLDIQHLAAEQSKDSSRGLKALLIDLPPQFTADGITGSDFFRHHALFIDLANQRVALRAIESKYIAARVLALSTNNPYRKIAS